MRLDSFEFFLRLLLDFPLLLLVVNPFRLRATLDLVLVFDHVLSPFSFTEGCLHLSVLLKFKVDLPQDGVHLITDELMSQLDDLGSNHVVVQLLSHLAGKLLDFLALFVIAQSNRSTLGPSSGSSTDAMEVSLGLIREREVDDGAD